MLTCIACSKQLDAGSLPEPDEDDAATTPSTRQAIKALTAQIKDMAVRASGAYKHCSNPCSKGPSNSQDHAESEAGVASERVRCAYTRTGSSNPTRRIWGEEAERGGGGTPAASESGRSESSAGEESKEWVAQVEPGVLITFVPLPLGGNGLKRIQFCRDMFNKRQAQRWWAENYDKVMELYNVQKFHRPAAPLPTTPAFDDVEKSKVEGEEGSPMASSISKEHPHRHPTRMSRNSSESLGHDSHHPTPKLGSIKAETSSSIGASGRSSCRSVSNGGSEDVMETEWVEEDDPGVYITIRALPDGSRELKRVRFSREIFGEMHARLWWEENRARIQQQYL